MTTINRPAGQHARSLAIAALVRGTAAGAVALGSALWSVKALAHPPFDTLKIGVPLVVAALFAGLARSEFIKRSKAAIGSRSERRVAKVVAKLGPDFLCNSLMIGAGGDADHTVLGPCVALIETKTGHGAIRVANGKLHAGQRTIPGDPLAQARRQAGAIAKITGVSCDAVVCIPDATSRPFVSGGVTICSLGDLPAVLRSLEDRLSPERAASIYRRLCDHEASIQPR